MEQMLSKYPNNTELVVYSQSDVIRNVDQVSKEINELRPLSKDTEDRIMQKLRLDWNYNSNAIEGNSLDYGETVAFLMHGVTAKGKPLKDYLDIRGHNDAINYLVELIAHNEEISEKDIRAIHEIILVEPYKSSAQTMSGEQVFKTIELGKYKTMPNHVKTITGEIHYYATPEETPILMGELIDWYRDIQKREDVHPAVVAAIFHHKFVSIHPFDDGNGRMARLLMNMILMKNHFPPVIIKKDSKDQYYLYLSQADSGNVESFINYISGRLLDTVELYLRGAKGESIEEPNDLDKKLLLFKKEIEARKDRVEQKKTEEVVSRVITDSVEPLINSCTITTSKFKDLFIDSSECLVSHREVSRSIATWVYMKMDLTEALLQKKPVLEDAVENDVVVFCFQFNDFKVKDNTFSFEVKIFIRFYDLDYRIAYTITNLDQLSGLRSFAINQLANNYSIQKFYHQTLSVNDIEKFTNEVGEKVFDQIQDIYSNGETVYDDFSEEEIRDAWELFLESEFSEEIRDAFYELKSVSINNNIITIDTEPADNHSVYNKNVDDVEEKFFIYLKQNSLINQKTLVQLV